MDVEPLRRRPASAAGCRRCGRAGAARSGCSRREISSLPGSATKARADLAALLGAHRDVLQVRIVRRQPPGGGRGQRVGGVDAAGLRVDLARAARRCRCPSAWRAGASRGSRGAAAWPSAARSSSTSASVAQAPVLVFLPPGRPHLAEQHVADLLGRADVERLAGQLVDLALEPAELLREVAGEARQDLAVDRMPRASIRASTGASGRSSVS